MIANTALHIQTGAAAARRIEREGLLPDHVSHLLAAAGGPKWLVLNRLDRFLFGEWFTARKKPLIGVGSSIGSWRLACAAQRDPLAAIQRFEDAYIAQRYGPKPSPEEISAEAERILGILLGANGVTEILNHPWLRLNIVTARCQGWCGSHHSALLKLGLLGATLDNLQGRQHLGRRFQRVIFHSPQSPPVQLRPDAFNTVYVTLNEQNLVPALLASASIPLVMAGVRDIPGAPPGLYRDGGMIDYHMDLDLRADNDNPIGIVFQPHFSARVIPGWLDKFMPWRKPLHFAPKLLVAPSAALIAKLPGAHVPDRHDFARYAPHDEDRFRAWRTVLDLSEQFVEEFRRYVTPQPRTRRVIEDSDTN